MFARFKASKAENSSLAAFSNSVVRVGRSCKISDGIYLRYLSPDLFPLQIAERCPAG